MALNSGTRKRSRFAALKVRIIIWLTVAAIVGGLLPLLSRPAVAENLKWAAVNLPADGLSGGWVLADGSDVSCLTQASDGTLYCCTAPSGTTYRLFKSVDQGLSWSYTGRIEENLVDIAIATDDPSHVYCATSAAVYASIDSGVSFTALEAIPGGAGENGIEITSLAVASGEGTDQVLVATRDIGSDEYGGLYWLDTAASSWQNTGIGSYDVYQAAFSPDYAEDGFIMAVVSDESDTLARTRLAGGAWGETVPDACLTGIVPVSVDLAFPDNFNANISPLQYTQYLALNTGTVTGGVYSLTGQESSDGSISVDIVNLNVGAAEGLSSLDIQGLAVSGDIGEVSLLAGAAASARIYFSSDSGATWTACIKSPSGDTVTGVAMASDFGDTGRLYAATSGEESAFSVSFDQGSVWSQTSLIDSRIEVILDLAVSPGYAEDETLFLLTAKIHNSLWRSQNGGTSWERIFCTSTSQGDQVYQVLLSTEYSLNKRVLLAGSINDRQVIWESLDNGRIFTAAESVDPDTGDPIKIDVWTLAPGDILFVGSYDGTDNWVYQTSEGGLAYIDKAKSGSQDLYSLVISPDFTDDQTVLAGNTSGGIYYSNDGGLVFEALPFDSTAPALAGAVSLAFDSSYSLNKTIYAADRTADTGIYRFVIGTGTAFESIDSTLPEDAKIGQIISSSGALYGLNTQIVDNSLNQGGLERSLDAAEAAAPVFESILSGLDDSIVLRKLWAYQNTLWTVDSVQSRLLTYADTLVSTVSLTSPADTAEGLAEDGVTLSWEALEGATGYHWQVDTDSQFSTLEGGLEGDTDASSVLLDSLESNTLYYWRVRADQPVLSRWSDVRSFITNQLEAPELEKPAFDATTSVQPVFRWSLSDGAAQYELQVAEDLEFSAPVIDQFCTVNFWECDTALSYSTTYYWRVRAVDGDNQSPWSAEIYLFTTEDEPITELDPPELSKPKSGSTASITPVFEWSASENAETYELLVSPEDSFTTLAIDKSGESACNSNVWACDISLDYETYYYWKVRAVAGEIYSDWSEVGIFITEDAPAPTTTSTSTPVIELEAPDLDEPGFNDTCEVQPVFRWDTTEGASQYELQLSRSSGFAELAADEVCTVNFWECSLVLDYSTSYYWRVRAGNGEVASDWSEIWLFQTEDAPAVELAAPELSKPKSGSTASVQPVFEWSVSDGAEGYELLVSTTDDFSTLAIDKSGESACNSNIWESDTVLGYGTTYYWKVRAVNSATVSAWSSVSLFITESEPTATPELAAPTLSEPKSTTLSTVEPVFKWSAVEGAEKYELAVSETDDFADLVIDKTGENACNTNAWKCDITLDYSSSYYWKVRAVSGDLVSEWSAVNVFTTKAKSSSTSSSSGSGGSSAASKATTVVTPVISPIVTVVLETLASSPVSPSPGPEPASIVEVSEVQEIRELPPSSSSIASPSPGPVTVTSTPVPASSEPVLTAISSTTQTPTAASGLRSWQYLLIFGVLIVGSILVIQMDFFRKKLK